MRLVLSGVEDDVVAARVRAGVDRRRRLGSLLASMDPHIREVAAEALLHERQRGRRQRFSRGGMELVIDGWRGHGRAPVRRSRTLLLPLDPAVAFPDLPFEHFPQTP